MGWLRYIPAKLGIPERFAEPSIFIIKITLTLCLWKALRFLGGTNEFITEVLADIAFVMGDFYANLISKILGLIPGVEMIYDYPTAVYPKGTIGFFIKDHCLAIPGTILFAAFILVIGGPKKPMAWFIPLGMIGVQLINLLRLLILSILLLLKNEAFFNFNHSYTAVVFTYGLIFLMLRYWIKNYLHKK